jgi:hypothetical protein
LSRPRWYDARASLRRLFRKKKKRQNTRAVLNLRPRAKILGPPDARRCRANNPSTLQLPEFAAQIRIVKGVLTMARELRKLDPDRQRVVEQISFRLEPALRAALESVAAAEHRTLSNQVRVIIARALEAQRDPAPA